jgi:DNA-binding IclR family transcriptional regulator
MRDIAVLAYVAHNEHLHPTSGMICTALRMGMGQVWRSISTLEKGGLLERMGTARAVYDNANMAQHWQVTDAGVDALADEIKRRMAA